MQFVDLKYQYTLYKKEIQAEIDGVLKSAAFIKGPALTKFETEMSDYLGGSIHAIGCSSGTDALLLGLMALDVQPGDEIIIPDFTFIATGEVVAFLGAVPVFCDVDPETYTIDPEQIRKKVTEKTVGIIPVSIFGQPADFDRINTLAQNYDLWVMEDGAQSFGAEYKGKKSCSLTQIAATSFFPAKPLGCYGDGGAVFTNDERLAEKVRIILNHGQIKRYHHAVIGINGRLDSLQAAILSVKLRHFDIELQQRQAAAEKYTAQLENLVSTPIVMNDRISSWAQYTVQHENRDQIREILGENEIPTAVHYPIPLHEQEAFSHFPDSNLTAPVTKKLSKQVFSLPMHPFLKDEDIKKIADIMRGII